MAGAAVELEAVRSYLDSYLDTCDIPDEPNAVNGLQVENSGQVYRVGAAVDACQATIHIAATHGCDLLLVHHGLFWRGNQPLIDSHFRRVRTLIQNDVAVYSSHIPLDYHAEVGNNAQLARALGLNSIERFGDYQGIALGACGTLVMSRAELVNRCHELLGHEPHVIAGGPEQVERVGVITGGAGSMIDEAKAAGLDTFITGEGAHYTHFDAEEGGINVIYGGHYATETFGVRALAQHLEQKFGLSWEFIDHPTGL